ncbi:MAG: immunoglobulin domain-containing protein [Verrucomicrobia bacterium]|nr:immunoglobulin domain-containing protein [Verrucomicrobiota bacterium]
MAIWVNFCQHSVQAFQGDLDTFNGKYGTTGSRLNSCQTCHLQNSFRPRNDYGIAYENAKKNQNALNAFQSIESLDSDGDGSSNLDEIKLLFFPGDAADRPSPRITAQPQSQSVNTGANVSFTVVATGAAPLRYQWRFNQAPISDATNPTLTKNNVQDSDVGVYDVVVSNSLSSVTSAPANLQVTSIVTPFFHWAVKPTQTGPAGGRHAVTDKNGNVYVAGNFSGELNFGGVTVKSRGRSDVFVARYDPNGKFDWLETAGGTDDDFATGVAVDAAGNCSVIGEFRGTIRFGDFSLTSSGGFDVFVASYNTSGLRRWVGTFGGSNFDLSKAIAVDGTGDVHITGWFFDRAVFGGVSLTSSGSSDVFVAKLDGRSGGTMWAKSFGGSSDDNVGGIAADAQGNSYVTGGFRATGSFGAFTLTTGNTDAIYVAKLDNAGVVQWARKSGGNPFNRSPGIAVDRPGSVYVTGSFRGNAQFDNRSVSSAGNDDDIFVAKYTNAGQLLWVTKAGGTGPDIGASVAGDGAGNCYVTGSFTGTATFDQTSLTSSGSSDLFVAKYDGNGRLVWAKRAGGSQGDSGSSIALDQDGNLFLTGGFSGLARFDEVNLSGAVGDVFVAKLSSRPFIVSLQPQRQTVEVGQNVTFRVEAKGVAPLSYQWKRNGVEIAGATRSTQTFASVTANDAGAYTVVVDSPGGSSTSANAILIVTSTASSPAVVWASKVGGTDNDSGNGVAVDAAGDVYVVGSFTGTAGFGGKTSLTSRGSSDLFIAKYKSTGELLWARQDGGPEGDRATSTAVDVSGNVVVTGTFRGRATFGPSGIAVGRTTLTSAGSDDLFIAEYNSSGTFIWARRAGGTGSDAVRGIAVDRSRAIYVTGSYSDASTTFGNTTLANQGDSAGVFREEIFIAKYDSTGNVLWAKKAGGTGNDSGNGIAVDSAGNCYVTGYFRDRATFGVGDLILFRTTLTSKGNTDIFLAKYNSSGRLVWARQAGGVADDLAWGVALDPAGNPYVTGEILGDATFGDIRLESSSRDIFIAKYSSSGDALWAQRAGGHLNQSGAGIEVDGSGSAYITGAFERSCFFGNPSSSNATLESSGLFDIFAAKYDSTGKFVWARKLGGSGEDRGQAIAVDSSGASFVTGQFAGTGDFGQTTLTAQGTDVFLARLAPGPSSGTAPTFQSFPTNQTVTQGGSVTFTAVVSGTEPLFFQWHKDGQLLSGANLSTLVIAAARIADAGTYTLVVTNSFGSVTSTRATLIVMPPTPPPPPPPPIMPVVRGFTGSQVFNTFGQTKTPGEPDHCGEIGGASFWNQIVAEDNGVLFVSTEGSDFDTVLAAYSGPAPLTSFDQLIAVACDNNSGADQKASRIFFPASKGQLYYVAVDGVNGAQGKVQLAHELVPAPTIVQQPTSQTVEAGANVVFSVEASGAPQSALPPRIGYQWQFGGKSIAGATSATLTLTNVQPANGGAYSVVVTNAAGSVTSNAAVLTVNPTPVVAVAPSITSQPQSKTVKVGGTVTLSVGATGTAPLSYQWKKNGTDLPGKTSATLTLESVNSGDAGNYTVVVSNSAGSATSSAATLTITLPLPLFSPVVRGFTGSQVFNTFGQTKTPGEPNHCGEIGGASFWNRIQAEDSGVLFVSTEGSDFDTVLAAYSGPDPLTSFDQLTSVVCDNNSGADQKTSRITFRASKGQSYYVVVDGVNGAQGKVQLAYELVPSPTIVRQPSSQTVAAGANATFSVEAAGASQSALAPHLSFQWQFNGNPIAGATAATLTMNNVQPANGGSYSVVVTNAAGSVTSSTAVLTVTLPPPTTRTVQIGAVTGSPGASVTIPITLNASGNEHAISFTLAFPASQASFGSVALGNGVSGGSLVVNNNQVASGRVGVVISLPVNQTLSQGLQELAIVTLNLATGLSNGTVVPVTFTNNPTLKSAADAQGNDLVCDFADGTITIQAGQVARPSLRAELSGKNIILSWPASATDFVMESSDSLETPAWTRVSLTPVVIGETNSGNIPISSGTRFYRLRSP